MIMGASEGSLTVVSFLLSVLMETYVKGEVKNLTFIILCRGEACKAYRQTLRRKPVGLEKTNMFLR